MRKYIFASILTLWMVLAGAADVFAQEGAPRFASLSLSVEAEETKFVLGQPITLKVRLTNPTESAISVLRDFDPAYGTLQLYVSRNGGEFKRYLGPGWGTKDPPRPTGQISPGEIVQGDITLLFHNQIRGRDDLLNTHVPVDEAGSYQFRVELYDADFRRKLAAPAIEVWVGFPSSYGGEFVWQALRADEGLAYFAQTGDAKLDNSLVATAEELSHFFPDNDQIGHLSLAIGTHHLKQGKADAAIRYFKEAAAAPPSLTVRARALVGLAKSHLEKGDDDEALKVSEAAAGEHGESEVRNELKQLGAAARKRGEHARSTRKRTQQ